MLVAVHDPCPRCGTPNLRATVRVLIELAGWTVERSTRILHRFAARVQMIPLVRTPRR